ncbi:[FeFe] hydrogenase, group A [Sporomusa sp. KB1]|uniref:[FeFe] hydrogenase, group A n=1 Tax=Sporomusa sp. KB1 TaxID=943346 RepID=UPI00210666F0|nr:[FeFe] hydrogenase, group A [Sporomusa sp. KB1]
MTRRSFLKFIGGASLGSMAVTIVACSTEAAEGRVPIDPDNPSIVRDDQKCILCGQCLEACEKVQSVYGYYDLPIKKNIICVNCGQCSLWCPTAAITERDDIDKVVAALENKDIHVVVQTAPATRVALGEEFGLVPGSIVEGQQVAALRELGFSAVFDTNYSADLTIMEEGTELVKRIQGMKDFPLPQFTSCSPGWVKFCEYYYSDLIPHLSTAKSPQQMLGALVKTYYAKEKGIAPEKIISVAIMPCTAKKFECLRPEMNSAGVLHGKPQIRDVDIVLTTRELARLMKRKGLDLNALEDAAYDRIMGEGTGAGVIFGTTGGVMEAAVRSAYYLITHEDPPETLLNLAPVRGLQGVKEATVTIPGVGPFSVAVCHGLKNSRVILDEIQAGKSRWQFIEFMSCPGGCAGGGGQPRTSLQPSDEVRQARIASLYRLDGKIYKKRLSYQNQKVQALYQNYLDHPMSELAEKLLHTHYTDRSKELSVKRKFIKRDTT